MPIERILSLTRDPSFRVRKAAFTYVLGNKGPLAESALMEGLQDPDPEVTLAAIYSLWAGPRPPEAIKYIAPLLTHPDIDLRFEAHNGFRAIRDPASIPVLIEALRNALVRADREGEGRSESFLAKEVPGIIVFITRTDGVPHLLKLLEFEERIGGKAGTLYRVLRQSTIASLEKLLERKIGLDADAPLERRRAVANALLRWWRAHGQAMRRAASQALLSSKMRSSWSGEATRLAKAGDPEGLSILESDLRSEDAAVRRNALSSLSDVLGDRRIELLERIWKSPDKELWPTAMVLWARRGEPTQIPRLRELLVDEKVPERRFQLSLALVWCGDDSALEDFFSGLVKLPHHEWDSHLKAVRRLFSPKVVPLITPLLEGPKSDHHRLLEFLVETELPAAIPFFKEQLTTRYAYTFSEEGLEMKFKMNAYHRFPFIRGLALSGQDFDGLLSSKDLNMVCAAIEGAGLLDPEEADRLVAKGLRHDHPAVRKLAERQKRLLSGEVLRD